MKTNFFTVLLIVTALFTGCKDDKSVDSLEVVTPEVVDTTYKVSVSVIVKKDDDFSLFYSLDNSSDFTKVEAIWQGVKGKDTEQSVTFNLPQDIEPTQLRLDFGMKQDQEDIILKSVKLEYKGKTRVFVGPEIGNYFRADENKCTYDPATGVIKAVVKDGKREFPSLYPHEKVLGPELQKMIQS